MSLLIKLLTIIAGAWLVGLVIAIICDIAAVIIFFKNRS